MLACMPGACSPSAGSSRARRICSMPAADRPSSTLTNPRRASAGTRVGGLVVLGPGGERGRVGPDRRRVAEVDGQQRGEHQGGGAAEGMADPAG